MMGVLSTPCSFGVLLAVFTWAQGQPTWLATLAILLIGAGMAAPHALLVAFPGLIRRLPRPGRWMELFKQAMGFMLLPVAIWLISTLAEDSYPFWVAGFAVVVTFALWMWGSWVRYDTPLAKKITLRSLAVLLAVSAGFWMLRPPGPLAVKFQPFDEAKIISARDEGRVVLVKFTAAWCVSCKWVDYFVYDRDGVAGALARRGVLAMKADVTNRDSPAASLLYGRLKGAPPLTVVYPPRGRPILLPGEISASDLLDALDTAAAKK